MSEELRNSKNSALASLTATYTDSENEDHNISDDSTHSDDADSSQSPQIILRKEEPSNESPETKKTPPRRNKALRLVSYIDDTVEDDILSPLSERIPIDDKKNVEDDEKPGKNIKTSPKKSDKVLSYGFNLPTEPKAKCSQELQEKITNLYEKMKNSNMDPNKIIQERKEFRNPSIYEKLIQFCDINELGTNYPPEIYDPTSWGKDSFYEELAKAQKLEMEKLEKSRKDNAKIDVNNVSKKAEEDMKKRKSKWDQPSIAVPTTTSSSVQPPLTTTISGTKGTVISALGPLLPKRV